MIRGMNGLSVPNLSYTLEQSGKMALPVDPSAVSIGKMVGANSVIVISVSYADKSGRLTLKVLDVETAEIIAMARQEF